MAIEGTIDLSFSRRDGFDLENWTATAHDGLVYIPARCANWDNGIIYPGVTTTIIDPRKLSVLGTAEDDRCASGGRVVFDAEGYAYVIGDGRNEIAPDTCRLRIAPGKTSFDQEPSPGGRFRRSRARPVGGAKRSTRAPRARSCPPPNPTLVGRRPPRSERSAPTRA